MRIHLCLHNKGVSGAPGIQDAVTFRVQGTGTGGGDGIPASTIDPADLKTNLAILIRGIGRVGGQTDVVLLEEIKKREQGFMSLAGEPRHSALSGGH